MPKEKGGKKAQSSRIEDKVRELAKPLLEAEGFLFWDAVFEKEGAMWYLRVLFDKEGGITTDECEMMTAPLNALLDQQSFIAHVDILEIGSPGLTRRLRHPEHFDACKGEPVRVTMRGENGKMMTKLGTLGVYDRDNDVFALYADGAEEMIPVKKAHKITLDL